MAIKKTIIEQDSNPTVVRTVKRVVDPNLHTPITENSHTENMDSETIHQTSVVHEPLVKTEHPQKIFEKKKTIFRFNQLVWYVLVIIEVLLGFRLTLKAIGADPFSGFASFIYALSAPLAVPFSGIVGASVNGNSVIEWSSMFAAVVYLILAWGAVNLFQIVKPVTPEEVEESV